jgi:hypothetical protein
MARRRRHRGQQLDAAARQANIDATLRYGSQTSALGQLLFQARADFHNQTRANTGAAHGIESLIGSTIPKVRKDYGAALKSQNQEQRVTTRRINRLGPMANDIKAASIREASGARRRVRESRADATTELRQRRTQARAGAAYANQAARGDYQATRSKIEGQLLDTLGQKGLFAVTEAMSTRKSQRDYRLALKKATSDIKYKKASLRERRQADRRRARISQQNANTSRYKATHPSKSRSHNGPTRTQRVAARDKYDRGVRLAHRIVAARKTNQPQVVDYLTEKLGSAVLARAAAQTVFRGGVGKHTRRVAHRRYGIKLPHPPTKRQMHKLGHQAASHLF